jgi:hypothetical protein
VSKVEVLQSRAFRGDHRLQACLTHDASHIPPGSKGRHVLTIQQALAVLGQVPPALWLAFEMESRAMSYGGTTSRVVLDYKTKRKIINRSYETRPDNIVGKMTIRSLDSEMIQYERSRGIL